MLAEKYSDNKKEANENRQLEAKRSLKEWIDFEKVYFESFEEYISTIKKFLEGQLNRAHEINMPSGYKILTESSIDDLVEKLGFKKTSLAQKRTPESLQENFTSPFESQQADDVLVTPYTFQGEMSLQATLSRSIEHSKEMGVQMNKLYGRTDRGNFDLYTLVRVSLIRDESGPISARRVSTRSDYETKCDHLVISSEFRYDSNAYKKIERLEEIAQITIILLEELNLSKTPAIFVLNYGTITCAVDNLIDIRR